MRFKFFILFAFLISGVPALVSAQDATDKSKPPTAEKKDKPQDVKPQKADLSKGATAEQIAESVVYFYGGLGGRDYLKQIRKTTIERGKISVVNAEGKTEQANYERLILRGDSLDKERVRFDQETPNSRYALIYNNDKIFGIFNDAVFAPSDDAAKSFQNQIWHGLEALLRYKENGSTLALAPEREKIMNVEFYVLDVTDKQNRQTRFYISTKTLHVMILEYTEDSVKYRRKFYDYNYAQGTLVPFRTVLWANGKQIEETNIQTISFGQKVEDDIFKES
ncbi:MAG: hypothetical protein ACR2HG_06630 [Pyrinomonadaceae bacterium]